MKRALFFLLICALLIGAASTCAYFDGYGYNAYCIIDADGCYVHNDEGTAVYIMFWSEASRAKIMGDLSAPGTNVVDYPYPYTYNGHLPLFSEQVVAPDPCPSTAIPLENCSDINSFILNGDCDPDCSAYKQAKPDGNGGFKDVHRCKTEWNPSYDVKSCIAEVFPVANTQVTDCAKIMYSGDGSMCKDYYQIVEGEEVRCSAPVWGDGRCYPSDSGCPQDGQVLPGACSSVPITCTGTFYQNSFYGTKFQCVIVKVEKDGKEVEEYGRAECPAEHYYVGACTDVPKTCGCGRYTYTDSQDEKSCMESGDGSNKYCINQN